MKIIFNSSMPRSGSTLLQNILAQNEAIYASPTSGVLELLYGARINFTDCLEFKAQDQQLMRKGFQGFCRCGLEGWYSNITDKPIVIDKSRGWLGFSEWLNMFVDSPKIIVCVRDLRYILGSMEILYHKNSDKVDKLENPSNMKFLTVHQRINDWLAGPPVGLSLLRIYDAVQRGTINNMCVIRYEDLLATPDKVLKKIYTYIEEPFYQHNLGDIKQVTFENDAVHDISELHKIRPVLAASETDPYELFGKTACDNIVSQNEWYFDYFYSAKSKFC